MPDWCVSVSTPSRIAVERRARRRQRLGLLKALGGVVALVLIAIFAAVAAVKTIGTIANPDTRTKLQRYVAGSDRVEYTSKSGRFRAALPADPQTGVETAHLFIPIRASRIVANLADKQSVEVAWFDLPAALPIADPAASIAGMAPLVARDLLGVATEGAAVSGVAHPSFEFKVTPSAASGIGNYSVRLIIVDHRVYELRVQSQDDASPALHTLAQSFQLLQ
jgi:hypothetical protein